MQIQTAPQPSPRKKKIAAYTAGAGDRQWTAVEKYRAEGAGWPTSADREDRKNPWTVARFSQRDRVSARLADRLGAVVI